MKTKNLDRVARALSLAYSLCRRIERRRTLTEEERLTGYHCRVPLEPILAMHPTTAPVPECPAEPARYGRICEVVGADEDTRRRARQRWRSYREAGLAPANHDV